MTTPVATVTHSKTLVSPSTGTADKVYGSDYVSASSHTVAWSGLGTNQLVYSINGTTLAQSANATYDGTSMTLAAGTITTDIAPLRLSETRNAVGTTFKGLTYTITDTASAAGSLAIQILGGAAGTTNLLSVAKAGQTTVGAGSGNTDLGLYFGTSGFGFFYYGSHVVSAGATGNGPAFGTNSLGFPQSTVLGWTGSSDPTAAKTLSLSQISAGVICVGTGAAGSFAGRLKLTSTITAAVAVASLNASPTIGEVQTVNDALAVTAKGATVAAGGTAVCQVMWNGSNWVGT